MGSNEEGMGVKGLYKGGRAGRPRGGDRPPGARAPPARDLVANLKTKKIHLGPVAPPPHRATGVYF